MLRCVQIAGLCHDLGHGPFSHTFETFFMNYKKEDTENKWDHASMSLKIAEHIIENLIDQDDMIDVSDIKIIKKLIKGREHNKSTCGLDPIDSLIEASFDIICNNRNGLDADRFDYLQRDSAIAPPNGTLPSLNCNRIICQSAVINGHITYNVKEIHPVWTVYMNRFSLFKQVYTHRKVRAMELMLCDGFRLADDIFKWSESLNDLDSFLDLTDSSIIYDIKKRAQKVDCDEKIKNSLKLINSVIHDRNSEYAYKYISEINISEPKLIKYLKDVTNEDRIARYTHGLSPDDIIIDWNHLNYGVGANDPLDSVYFFSSDNENEAFIAHKEYRGTHPRYFEECNVRLYCKNKKVAHLAKEAHLHFISNDVFSETSPIYKEILK
ncbi:HD superfamily phosphohydrolase protein, putative [Plasmodium malariae]|uniref:HD superfamily phosphohydrolase protein, putative n=1 Tax=Plasmodium malariae TaxID=5858 RepID=A0A1C3L3D3_PLAMA|nr:HD superfamily phosphohydrolase protein, putative [Plasmodium malariae]